MSYKRIAKRAKVSPEVVRAVLNAILIECRSRHHVRLRHFGTFKIRRTAPRIQRDNYSKTTRMTNGRVTLLFECSKKLVAFLSGTLNEADDDPMLETAVEFRRRDERDGNLPKRKAQ